MTWEDRLDQVRNDLTAGEPLRLVLQGGVPGVRMTWPATACPGCGEAVRLDRSPYCGESCREKAGFVRQCRAMIERGLPPNDDRRQMLSQVLWGMLGGGYPHRLLEIPGRTIEKVLERDEGRCYACRGPADQVEHLRTACNRPINLAAVCARCRRTCDYMDAQFLERNDVIANLRELGARSTAEQPLRRCDDPVNWDWRAFLRERKPQSAS